MSASGSCHPHMRFCSRKVKIIVVEGGEEEMTLE